MQNIRHYLLLLLALLLSPALSAHTLKGRIIFNDSLPAPYVTIYIPATGQGTITDLEGQYCLENLSAEEIEVQFSLVGYKTIKKKINLSVTQLLNLCMEEQAIQLSNVYVTPDGQDPALYILNKVIEQAEKNRARLVSYTANMEATLHAQDMDFIPMLVPKTAMWFVRRAIRAAHFGATFDHCISNPTVDVTLRTTQLWKKGKVKNTEDEILSANPPLSSDASSQMLRVAHFNLFDQLYGDKNDWGKKGIKESRFELKGTFEEEGLTIDVLEFQEGFTMKGKEYIPMVTRLYVIEDIWAILRIESNSDAGKSIIECRNIGGNIYLPISKITEPSAIDINDGLKEAIQDFKESQDKKPRAERQIMERIESVLKSGRRLRPYMATGYVIKYSGVEVK